MEVGAVKQAFNNELILMKKKLNQAKIQIIHKLTRKAKTFTEKKAPEALKDKLKRKAESAVNEVLIIKKIKPKDLAKFAVTHKGQLNDHLNKPTVDQDKACARLLLHKALQDKYKLLRSRFSSIPIEDLLMSREERRKLKKEEKEKQKNRRKEKAEKAKNVVNAEGDWEVEDVVGPNISEEENEKSGIEQDVEDEENAMQNGNEKLEASEDVLSQNETDNESVDEPSDDVVTNSGDTNDEDEDKSEDEIKIPTPMIKPQLSKPNKSKNKQDKTQEVVNNETKIPANVTQKSLIVTNKEKRPNKNKNLNEKLVSRKFRKETTETAVHGTKIVDPFFITSTGENYMSVVEPRPPDEVKEVHKQGNRKLRRAVMFGHIPKIKPRQNNYEGDDTRFNRNNGLSKNNNLKRFNDKEDFSNDKRNYTAKRNRFDIYEKQEAKPEKLHPSWEAKKRQSGIQPFQGKKIVFDEC